MTGMKYKLIRAGKRDPHYLKGLRVRYYRLQALRDIPEHGVKAGDLGGFITKGVHLSHYGSCWVGGEAHVIGRVEIINNAYVGGNATVSCHMKSSKIVVSENAKIIDKARVITVTNMAGQDMDIVTIITGQARISGKAHCQSIYEASGYAEISDNAFIEEFSRVTGTAKVFENARIGHNAQISGKSEVYGDTKIKAYCTIEDSVVLGNTLIEKSCMITSSIVEDTAVVKEYANLLQTVITGNAVVPIGERLNKGLPDNSGIMSTQQVLDEVSESPKKSVPASSVPSLASSTVSQAVSSTAEPLEALALFNELKDSIAAYETDVVKLIKYPAMVDQGISETLAMTLALKKATRLSNMPRSKSFADAVEILEEKFVVAESHAIKMASTILSEEGLKKTQKAKDLFRIASNGASTEQEKKVAFIQGFKQLEGIIAVPEVAVDTFRVKIGLQELEALSLGED